MRAGIRPRPWAGLDIGSYSVKLLATLGRSRYWISEAPFPPSNGGPQSHQTVARVVEACMEQAGLAPRSVRGITLGISGPDVILKPITLPFMQEEEIGPALRFEARKHLPFDPQAMVIDYQVLERQPSERRLEVLLAAVSQQNLEQRLAPLRLLGMDPDIVDAAPLALVNALAHEADPAREACLVLDIGHASSHLALHQRGEPFFSRRLDFGGRTITQAIAEGMGFSFEEAEEWKVKAGTDHSGGKLNWEAPEMSPVLECLRRNLVVEVHHSLAFYRTMGNVPESLRLWITGGTARLPGLAAHLSELMETPVLLFNPMERLPGSPRGGRRPAVGPQFTQAFGLALRSA